MYHTEPVREDLYSCMLYLHVHVMGVFNDVSDLTGHHITSQVTV